MIDKNNKPEATFLYSDAPLLDQWRTHNYIFPTIAYPDKNSEFDRKIGAKKYILRIPLLNQFALYAGMKILKRLGYNLLMLESDKEIRGHTAFQVHGDSEAHVFSVKVDETYQGRGLATYMQNQLIEALRPKGIERIRFGAGGHKAMDRIHEKMRERSDVEVQDNNWVRLL